MQFQSLGQEDPPEKEMLQTETLQYSCLENPMDRGAWWATVHSIAGSDMTEQLSAHTHTHTFNLEACKTESKL